MLRIDPTRFLLRHVEELSVKVTDVFEETALPRVHLAGLAIGTVKAIDVPTIVRDVAHGIDAVEQILPELLNVVGTGKAATHADDGDVFSNRAGVCGTCCRGDGRGFRLTTIGQHELQHMVADRVDRWMIEQHRGTNIESIAEQRL